MVNGSRVVSLHHRLCEADVYIAKSQLPLFFKEKFPNSVLVALNKKIAQLKESPSDHEAAEFQVSSFLGWHLQPFRILSLRLVVVSGSLARPHATLATSQPLSRCSH